MSAARDIAADIAARCVTPRPDCQLWMGATDRGYGRISVDGVVKRVHRVAWELVNGPIPEGLVVDHLCGIKNCVNLEHLELVTVEVNNQRGVAAFLRRQNQTHPRQRTTHCPNGHEKTPQNTYQNQFTDPGHDRCQDCDRERNRAKKKRAA